MVRDVASYEAMEPAEALTAMAKEVLHTPEWHKNPAYAEVYNRKAGHGKAKAAAAAAAAAVDVAHMTLPQVSARMGELSRKGHSDNPIEVQEYRDAQAEMLALDARRNALLSGAAQARAPAPAKAPTV